MPHVVRKVSSQQLGRLRDLAVRIAEVAGLLMIGVWSVGCAQHGVVHTASDESRPHISWELRAGRVEGDEKLVCGSVSPGVACVLAASATGIQSRATVHLLFHAAQEETKYTGALQVPFFGEENRERTMSIDETVPPNSPPARHTVSGIVTTSPGKYAVTIRVETTQHGRPSGPLAETIEVLVR